MNILFDQGTPKPLKKYLPAHYVRTAWEQGWSQVENGALLEAAEKAAFDLLVTTDSNLKYQQNLSGRKIALIVLLSTNWVLVEKNVASIIQAIERARTGSYEEIALHGEN